MIVIFNWTPCIVHCTAILRRNVQQVSKAQLHVIASTSVRRIFERRGRKFENNGDQKKKVSTQNQSVSLPNIRWGPKKKEKRSLLRFCPFLCSNFLPKLQRRGPCRNFAYYSMLIILYWRLIGGGHGTVPPPPLKYAPDCVCGKHSSFWRNVATVASHWQQCSIWPGRRLNLRPPAPEANALPLVLLHNYANFFFILASFCYTKKWKKLHLF